MYVVCTYFASFAVDVVVIASVIEKRSMYMNSLFRFGKPKKPDERCAFQKSLDLVFADSSAKAWQE